ncbi:MAG: DUF4856 domain-containing protein [Myxococcota bacterium]
MIIPFLLFTACSDKSDSDEIYDTASSDDTDTSDTSDTTDTTDTSDTSDTSDTGDTTDPVDEDVYQFLRDGSTSVSYSGQTFRLALITEFASWLDSRQDALGTSWNPSDEAAVLNDINFYLEFDSSIGGQIPFSFVSNTAEENFDGISSGKDIVGKLAGNDSVTDHKNWTSGDFTGWSLGGTPASPEALVGFWGGLFASRVISTGGAATTGPDGSSYTNVAITPDGHDLTALLHNFILMGVTFSQGTDDYLDDDTDGKGLKASHDSINDGKNYTSLEHQWDEGFGYLGAAKDFLSYTNMEVISGDSFDSDGDGKIDLKSEYNWTPIMWAATIDHGTSYSNNPTDFANTAVAAFIDGRSYIAETPIGTPQADYLATLTEYRNIAVDNWDHAVAGTVVHHLNNVLEHMSQFGSSNYDFEAHATSWSTMKGISLGLQFNPRSTLSDNDFSTFHNLVGDAPTLPNAGNTNISNYIGDLESARSIIGSAYGFQNIDMW